MIIWIKWFGWFVHKSWFFLFVPAESERGFVAIVGSVFHLCIFTPSHSHIFSCSHRVIFIFTSFHCHISLHSRFSCFDSLSFFISAHLFTTSPSNLLIFKSSQLQIYSLFVNAHLHIGSSYHSDIFSFFLALKSSHNPIFFFVSFFLFPLSFLFVFFFSPPSLSFSLSAESDALRFNCVVVVLDQMRFDTQKLR